MSTDDEDDQAVTYVPETPLSSESGQTPLSSGSGRSTSVEDVIEVHFVGIKCRERTQRVATSGSRTSVRAGTPRSCATKPRPHATSKAKNGRGCFLPFFRFQHLAGFIFAEKSVQWKAERQMSKASFVARN